MTSANVIAQRRNTGAASCRFTLSPFSSTWISNFVLLLFATAHPVAPLRFAAVSVEFTFAGCVRISGDSQSGLAVEAALSRAISADSLSILCSRSLTCSACWLTVEVSAFS